MELEIGGGLTLLSPISPEIAARLARELSETDPWKTHGYGAEALARYLSLNDPSNLKVVAVDQEGNPAAVAAVRHPWLRGPCLELLAVLSGHRSKGVGSALLAWFLSYAGERGANAWVTVSDFNRDALRFYQRHGFLKTAELPDLVSGGRTEYLLRRRLP